MLSSYHISRYEFTSFFKKSVTVREVPEVVYGVSCGVDSEAFRVTRNDRTLSALLAWKFETSRAIGFLLRLMSLMQMQKCPCANSD